MPSRPASTEYAGGKRIAISCTAWVAPGEMLALPLLSVNSRKRWLLWTSLQGMSSGGLHPSNTPTGITMAQPPVWQQKVGKGKDKNSTWDSGSSEQNIIWTHTHEESKKGISAIWKKKNATNNEERNQAYDTVRERAEWIITSNPNASKTTEKRWAKTQ